VFRLCTTTVKSAGSFRRLGVFLGGADLEAIEAVTAHTLRGAAPLDVVADLVDASLATISEGADGEPRIGMLETIRAFAHDRLQSTGEVGEVRRIHAEHYLAVARQLKALTRGGGGDDELAARHRLELEIDNFREALSWSLQPDGSATSPDHLPVGLGPLRRASSAVGQRRILRRGAALVEHWRSPVPAKRRAQIWQIASNILLGSHLGPGMSASTSRLRRGVWRMWRRLGDKEGLSLALSRLTVQQESVGDLQAARAAAEEAVSLARELSAKHQLANALATLSNLEALEHNLDRALELIVSAVDISLAIADEGGLLVFREIQACTLRELGRLEGGIHIDERSSPRQSALR
ncbi:MAG: hypothetical protein WKF82_13715, partial [Nocardioidaceae bacterium]